MLNATSKICIKVTKYSYFGLLLNSRDSFSRKREKTEAYNDNNLPISCSIPKNPIEVIQSPYYRMEIFLMYIQRIREKYYPNIFFRTVGQGGVTEVRNK